MDMTTSRAGASDSVAPVPPSHSDDRRRRRWRVARNVVLGVLAAIVAVWLVLFITKGRFLKRPFESIVGRMTHRTVTVGGDFQLYFAPLRIKFYAEALRVSNPSWATRPDLFYADRIDTRIAPLSLLFGRKRLYSLDLLNGAGDLEWDRAHRRNTWTFSEEKGEPFELPRIDVATVRGTRVRYLDPQLRLLTNVKVDDIRALDRRIGRAVGLTGDGQVRDTPFTLEARLLSPDATVNRGKNALEATIRAAGNVVTVAGTLPSLADIEGVPLRTTARGSDLSTLLGIIGITLPRTRDYRVAAQLVKEGNEYRFTRLTGVAGGTDLAGRFTVTNAERLHIGAVLATRRLDIIDAAPFIGYNPDIVAAKGTVAAAAATGAGPARVLPDAAFPVDSMKLFDADLKWTIGAVRSRNVPISAIDLTLDLERGRLALSPLSFEMARGHVASDIIFDTRPRPSAVSYDVRIASTPLGRLLAGYGVVEAGTTGTLRGRIQMKGRGDTIHQSLATATGRMAFVLPQGTFWTRNVQLAEIDLGTFAQKMFQGQLKEPVRLNCGLVAFTVRNGIAAADPVLIDTSKNVILARGGFSFRDEAMDLAFRADSKKFSLFSGQSPVGLGGYFAQPALNVISPDLIARAGAGLGLAVVASPLAGLLAFVDVGDAKTTACGPVLAGARAAAQRTTKGEKRDDVGNGTPSKAEDGKPEKKGKFLGIF